MTTKESEIIIKLLETLKQPVSVEADDSEIVKAIVFNIALRESQSIITRFVKGEIEQDVIESL